MPYVEFELAQGVNITVKILKFYIRVKHDHFYLCFLHCY